MRAAIAGLFSAASRRLRADADSRPMAPQSAAAQGKPLSQPLSALLAPAATMTANRPLFAASPLVTAETPHIADLIRAVYADEKVQSHAGLCRLKMLHLVEVAVFGSEIAQAIKDAVAADDDLDIVNVTPQAVAEMLRRRAVELDDALNSAKEDHRKHDAAARQAAERHRQLRQAVSTKLDALILEKKTLNDRADAMGRNGLAGDSRFAKLRAAGLDDRAIAQVQPDALNPVREIEAMRARVRDLGPIIDRLWEFSRSPTFSATPLAGMPEFAELIAARNGAKVEA